MYKYVSVVMTDYMTCLTRSLLSKSMLGTARAPAYIQHLRVDGGIWLKPVYRVTSGTGSNSLPPSMNDAKLYTNHSMFHTYRVLYKAMHQIL